MNIEKYFSKTGVVYGISGKNNFATICYVTKFDNLQHAKDWLHTEEYDFRERELCSKNKSISIAGKDAVENTPLNHDIYQYDSSSGFER